MNQFWDCIENGNVSKRTSSCYQFCQRTSPVHWDDIESIKLELEMLNQWIYRNQLTRVFSLSFAYSYRETEKWSTIWKILRKNLELIYIRNCSKLFIIFI